MKFKRKYINSYFFLVLTFPIVFMAGVLVFHRLGDVSFLFAILWPFFIWLWPRTWKCPGCGRSIRKIMRWRKQSKLFEFPEECPECGCHWD